MSLRCGIFRFLSSVCVGIVCMFGTVGSVMAINYPFSVKVNLEGQGNNSFVYFRFSISAAGDFTINCGNSNAVLVYGGTDYLDGIDHLPDNSNGDFYITRNNTTLDEYACKYPSATTPKFVTIGFRGQATAYNDDDGTGVPAPAITFTNNWWANPQGDLSAIFGEIGDNQTPAFVGTFEDIRWLTNIPSTLFASLTRSGPYMFYRTFKHCVHLQSIPAGLFGNLDGWNGDHMFAETFSGSGFSDGMMLSQDGTTVIGYTHSEVHLPFTIPPDLFANIRYSAPYMFYRTFANAGGVDRQLGIEYSNQPWYSSSPLGWFVYNGENTQVSPMLFAGLLNQNPHPDADNFMTEIFDGVSFHLFPSGDARGYFETAGSNSVWVGKCPIGYYQYITGYEHYWDNTAYDGAAVCLPCPSGTGTNGALDPWNSLDASTSCGCETYYNSADYFAYMGVYDNDFWNYYLGSSPSLDPQQYLYLLGMPASSSTVNPNEVGGGNGSNSASFSFGDVSVENLCSVTPGIYGVIGNPDTTQSGDYCWCRVRRFNPTSGDSVTFADGESNWVFVDLLGGHCSHSVEGCAHACRAELTKAGSTSFRESLYSTYHCPKNFDVSYDCANGFNGWTGQNDEGYGYTHHQPPYVDGDSPYDIPSTSAGVFAYTLGDTATFPEPSHSYSCSAPTSGYNLLGWYCSYTSCGYSGSCTDDRISVSVADTWMHSGMLAYNHPVFGDDNNPSMVFSDSFQFEVPGHTYCRAIWQKELTCPEGESKKDYVLGVLLADANIEAKADGVYSGGSNNNTVSFSGTIFNNHPYQIRFETRESSTHGIVSVVGNPSLDSGNQCWCRVTEYDQDGTGSNFQVLNDMPWVYAGVKETTCLSKCGNLFATSKRFRTTAYVTHRCEGKRVIYNCNKPGTAGTYNTYFYPEGEYVTATPETDNCVLSAQVEAVREDSEFVGWYCTWGDQNIHVTPSVERIADRIWVHENFIASGQSVTFQLEHDTLCVGVWRKKKRCQRDERLDTLVLGGPASDFDQSWWIDRELHWEQLNYAYTLEDTIRSDLYGSVIFESKCSTTEGMPGFVGEPSNSSGARCWCRVREYRPLEGEIRTFNNMPWVYIGWSFDSVEACTNPGDSTHISGCMHSCTLYMSESGDHDGDPYYAPYLHSAYTTQQCVANETFTVTYSCGENASGTAPVDSNSPYNYGINATILSNTNADTGEDYCTREGYTFSDWDCGAVGEYLSMTHDYVCEARWQQNETFTVTYSCGENATGDAPVDNGTYTSGQTATILSNGEDNCTYEGYTFSGWDCGTVGEGIEITGNVTCTAQWQQNETFTVTYSCGENASGTAPVDNGTYTSGQTATILSNGEDNCTYEGYTFNGWDCGTVGEGIEITGNVTCTAQWQRDYEFWVDTMSLNSGDNFKFKISARGTFYVNCGENGTLSGNGGVSQDSLGGANGYVIDRTSNTSNDTYICNYSSGGEKTIAFAGDATGYGSGINVPATTFDTETGHINAQKVNAIRGDLSAVFGYIGSANNKYPRFIGTFQNCRNLTSIPNTLFASLTNSGEYMFGMTFKNCVGLVSTNANNNQPIPGDLFNFGGNNVSGAEIMFKSTFEGCSGLTSIPENLFSHINGSANKLFSATFMDCTNLTSIPGNLFNFGGNNVSGAEYMFYQTFENCAGLTTIPENLFAHISSSAQYMFANAFAGCSSLVSIPENLFAFSGSSVIPGGRYMFQETFKNCVGLTSIPEGLFVHVMVPSSSPLPSGMFNMTFYGCTGLKYLPKNLFSHITNPAQNLFQETFKNCTGFENYTDSNGEMRWRFIPPTLFNGLIDEDSPFESNMMLNIFNGDTTLYQCCPAGFEKFDVGFWYANWWSPYVSCAACPEGTTAAEILEGSGCYECLEPGEQAGGIRIATSNMSSGDTFDFDLSAAGTFYVDCGVDGRLVSTTDDVTPGEVTGWVIRRNNTDNATYRCSYSSRGEKMVRFSGRATAYNGEVGTGSNGEMTAVPAISFEPARERLVSVDGDLSKMFPILGQSDKKIPRFYRTFANCVSLEKISGKLFRRYTSGTTLMFGSTFAGCRRLKEIPGNLFSNIVKGADQMFVQTFSGCSRLEGFIAPNLFAGLIANHSPYSKDMMRGIFDETSLATRCPEKYSQYITGYERYWDKHVSCEPMQTYNVVYDCGGGLGRAPASKEIRVGEVFIAANNTCTPPRDDMVFAGWEVSGTDDVSREESSTEWGYRESKTLTAKWAPSSGFECKTGKYLHIGEERMCLAEEEEVEKPALAVGVKGKNVVHYLQMTVQDMNSEPLPINDKSSKKLNILYKGDLYNVHDGSVGK